MNLESKERLAAVFIGAAALIAGSILFFGWAETWLQLGVNTLSPAFADLRHVQASLATQALGINPQIENPGDPWQRPLNYPTIWLSIASLLSIDREPYYLLLCLALVLTYVCIATALLLRHPSVPLLFALLSNAALLCVERANTDLLIFALMFAFALLATKPLVPAPIIAVATVLKIYPVCALGTLAILNNRRALLLAVPLCIGSLILFSDELATISKINVPTGGNRYGLPQVSFLIGDEAYYHLYCASLSLLAGLLFFLLPYRRLPCGPRQQVHLESYALFLTGGVLYCSTYLLSSNWDYRLILLALCIPYVSSQPGRFWNLLLCLILLLMNTGLIQYLRTMLTVSATHLLDIQDIGWVVQSNLVWRTLEQVMKSLLFAMLTAVACRDLSLRFMRS